MGKWSKSQVGAVIGRSLIWVAFVAVAIVSLWRLVGADERAAAGDFFAPVFGLVGLVLAGLLLVGAVVVTRNTIRGFSQPELDDQGRRELEKLNQLLEAGALTEQEHARAVDKLKFG